VIVLVLNYLQTFSNQLFLSFRLLIIILCMNPWRKKSYGRKKKLKLSQVIPQRMIVWIFFPKILGNTLVISIF